MQTVNHAHQKGTIAIILTAIMLIPWVLSTVYFGQPGAGSDPLLLIPSLISIVVLPFTIIIQVFIVISTILEKNTIGKFVALKWHLITLALFFVMVVRFIIWKWLYI